MRVKLSSKNIFLIIALILAAIIGYISCRIAQNQYESYIINVYGDGLESSANGLAIKFFDFTKNVSLSKTGNQDDYLSGLMQDPNLTGASITDANGVIIASTNKSKINLGLLEDTSWQKAVGGQRQIDNLDLSTGTATFYLPLSSKSGLVRGVVVLDTTLPNSVNNISAFTNVVLFTVLGTLGLFIFISYLVMYELETKMEEKERSIFDQSKAQTEEKQLYEAITSSLAESLIVINKNKQIMMMNPETEKLIGHKSSDVEYRSYEKILGFYEENGKKIKKDPIKTALENGNIIHITSKDGFYTKNKVGTLIPVAINIAPVTEGKSFIKGVALTIIDISTEKELQKVKDEFVYVVAHELGNPIFALDGYLSLIEDKSKGLSKQNKEMLASAQGVNRQLSSLVNDLLEVARNETGRLTFELEKIDLTAIALEVIKNSEFKAREKKIKLVYKKVSVPKAIGNERKIKEVFTNLVDNAIKYTNSKGMVTVKIESNSGQVITSVSDNGIGLSEESQKHLFEKFFRVKEKATEGISGTGLGLFIAKQIVEKCGGKIWAESSEGKGSTFNFSLKISK